MEDEIVPLQNKIMAAQQAEPDIRNAIEQLKNPRLARVSSGPFRNQRDMRLDHSERLCKGQAVVVPQELQKEVTGIAHRLSHAGIQKNFEYMRDRFFWVKMRSTIESYCAHVQYVQKTRGDRREGSR